MCIPIYDCILRICIVGHVEVHKECLPLVGGTCNRTFYYYYFKDRLPYVMDNSLLNLPSPTVMPTNNVFATTSQFNKLFNRSKERVETIDTQYLMLQAQFTVESKERHNSKATKMFTPEDWRSASNSTRKSRGGGGGGGGGGRSKRAAPYIETPYTKLTDKFLKPFVQKSLPKLKKEVEQDIKPISVDVPPCMHKMIQQLIAGCKVLSKSSIEAEAEQFGSNDDGSDDEYADIQIIGNKVSSARPSTTSATITSKPVKKALKKIKQNPPVENKSVAKPVKRRQTSITQAKRLPVGGAKDSLKSVATKKSLLSSSSAENTTTPALSTFASSSYIPGGQSPLLLSQASDRIEHIPLAYHDTFTPADPPGLPPTPPTPTKPVYTPFSTPDTPLEAADGGDYVEKVLQIAPSRAQDTKVSTFVEDEDERSSVNDDESDKNDADYLESSKSKFADRKGISTKAKRKADEPKDDKGSNGVDHDDDDDDDDDADDDDDEPTGKRRYTKKKKIEIT